VPGYRGAERREKFEKDGFVEIDDAEWEKFSVALDRLLT
jgi:hypothetical protein